MEQCKQNVAPSARIAGSGRPEVEAIREPYYRIVCDPVYGGEWPTAEAKIGPGTFWTPRLDAIKEMMKTVFHFYDESAGRGAWDVAIYRVTRGTVRTVENENVYGRQCQQGERLLDATEGPPERLLAFHPRQYPSPLERLRLLASLDDLFGEKIERYRNFRRGLELSFKGEQLFLLEVPERRAVVLAAPRGDWRFEERAEFKTPEALWRFLDSKEVKVLCSEDLIRFDYFFSDMCEQKAQNKLSAANAHIRRSAQAERRRPFVSHYSEPMLKKE